jgi:hypothetical protein
VNELSIARQTQQMLEHSRSLQDASHVYLQILVDDPYAESLLKCLLQLLHLRLEQGLDVHILFLDTGLVALELLQPVIEFELVLAGRAGELPRIAWPCLSAFQRPVQSVRCPARYGGTNTAR